MAVRGVLGVGRAPARSPAKERAVISFRPMEPRDRPFVVTSWIDSYRTAYTAGLISMKRWSRIMRVEIEDMLDRPAQVIVAYDPEDTDHVADLLGFIAYDIQSFRLPYVYYVYVKATYRRWGYRNRERVGDGVARQLFRAAGIDPEAPFQYAASTPKVRELKRKIPCARHQPLLARFPLEEARRHDAEQR
jgi:hypothetical protein